MPEGLLILRQMNHPLHLLCIQSGIKQTALHAPGQEIKEDLVQFPCVDGPSECRKSYMEPHGHALIRNLAGAALQNRLPAAADGQQTAFSRTLGLKIILLKLLSHLTHQEILQRNAGAVSAVVSLRKSGQRMGNFHMETGGRREGVSLHMIDHQCITVKFPLSRQRFIRRIALVVYRTQ